MGRFWHSTDPARCWPSAAHGARFLGLSGHQSLYGRELGAAAVVVPRSLLALTWNEGLAALVTIASKGKFWLVSGQTGPGGCDGAATTNGRRWTR